MEQTTRTAGRPPIDPDQKKKSYALSFTPAEYAKLQAQAEAAGYKNQPSKYLIKKLKLS